MAVGIGGTTVASGLDFVSKNLDFLPGDLEIPHRAGASALYLAHGGLLMIGVSWPEAAQKGKKRPKKEKGPGVGATPEKAQFGEGNPRISFDCLWSPRLNLAGSGKIWDWPGENQIVARLGPRRLSGDADRKPRSHSELAPQILRGPSA
jgi:hypothetical protein